MPATDEPVREGGPARTPAGDPRTAPGRRWPVVLAWALPGVELLLFVPLPWFDRLLAMGVDMGVSGAAVGYIPYG